MESRCEHAEKRRTCSTASPSCSQSTPSLTCKDHMLVDENVSRRAKIYSLILATVNVCLRFIYELYN
jgi:hypothetical protein